MQSWSKIVEDEGMQEHKNEGMFRHLNCIMPERIAQTSAHTHQTTNKNSASHPRICVTWAPTTGAFVAFALFALFASCQRWMTWRLVSQQRTATTKIVQLPAQPQSGWVAITFCWRISVSSSFRYSTEVFRLSSERIRARMCRILAYVVSIVAPRFD